MSSCRFLWISAAVLLFVGCEKSYESVIEPNPVEEEDPWLFKDLLPEFQEGQDGPVTIGADFSETRSTIEMNESETFAATKWTAGDSFKMYGYSNGYYRTATFSTNESGVSAEFSTSGSISYAAPYYAVYPSASKFGSSNGQILVGVHLPSEQEAVSGGFKDGLTISYTTTPNMTDFLHFKSQVSLVRFRMTGELVSQVKTVALKGTSSLSGDAIIVVGDDGEGILTQDRSFQGDSHFSYVSLSGDFVAGQDYYLVLFPGTQSSFQMVFTGEDGHSTTKVATQFTFPRARISDFGTIDIGSEFTDGYVDPTPIHYMEATAAAPKPVTIAVIPEGFTADEMSTYEMLAKSGIDALMNTEPFNSYREYFNVWILKVASNESGASITDGNGTITTLRDCYFGSKWGEGSYDDMAANENTVYDYVTNHCPDIVDGIHTIYEVPILMIINDTRYGGICHSYSNGKGYCMAPYSYEGGTIAWRYASQGYEAASVTAVPENMRRVTDAERQEMGLNNGNWLNTLVHEFGGHCFSRLSDEYWYNSYKAAVSAIQGHSYPVPYGLNISATYSDPVWKADLLGDDLQVKPSLLNANPLYGRIGVFQGGEVSMFNRWRSEKISCMIDNRFYFSTWQRMIIVKRIMTLSGSTFEVDEFWRKDNPIDPLRDAVSSQTMGVHPLPVREVPMLPPPVLHEE